MLNNLQGPADIEQVKRLFSQLAVLLVCACVLAPAAVWADSEYDCTKPFRQIGPVKITKADIRTPVNAKGTPKRYQLDATWTNVDLRVSQFVKIKNGPKFYGSSFSDQKAISVDAYPPEDNGWLWVDDADPKTAPCEMLGRRAWQPARIFVRETKKVVYIAAASQPTIGNHTGCVLGPDYGVAGCATISRNIMKLKSRVGKRKIVLETWGPVREDGHIVTPTATVLA